MKVSIRPYGENELEIDPVVFKTKESVERFIITLEAAAKLVWRPEKKKPE